MNHEGMFKCPCCDKELTPEHAEMVDDSLKIVCPLCTTQTNPEDLGILIISPTMSTEVIGQILTDQIRKDGEDPEDFNAEEIAELVHQAVKHFGGK